MYVCTCVCMHACMCVCLLVFLYVCLYALRLYGVVLTEFQYLTPPPVLMFQRQTCQCCSSRTCMALHFARTFSFWPAFRCRKASFSFPQNDVLLLWFQLEAKCEQTVSKHQAANHSACFFPSLLGKRHEGLVWRKSHVRTAVEFAGPQSRKKKRVAEHVNMCCRRTCSAGLSLPGRYTWGCLALCSLDSFSKKTLDTGRM